MINMKKIKNRTKGITLISLAITIIILLILAGISIYSGKGVIQKAKLEELKTNMLLIQAKAKEYVEEVNFRMGIGTEEEKIERRDTARQEIYVESEKLEKARKCSNTISDRRIRKRCLLLFNTGDKRKMGITKVRK